MLGSIKRVRNLVVCILFCGAGSAEFADGATVEKTYQFSEPQIGAVRTDEASLYSVKMTDAPSVGKVGWPALPAVRAQLLLPYGSQLRSVKVQPGEEVALGVDFLVEPVAPPTKLSEVPQSLPPLQFDSAVYSSSDPVHASFYDLVGVQSFRGYQIVILRLYPVQYVPATGRVSYYPRLTVLVETEPAPDRVTTFRGVSRDAELVRQLVDNPEVVTSYPFTTGGERQVGGLLIITLSSLTESFEPLKAFHDAEGIPTEIRTITGDVGGSDPQTIRDYIRERYLIDGIDYVLLGGDDEFVPAPDLWVQAWTTVETAMPGDFFFGCLDGTFNFDGDQYWGEPTDGDGGGDVDLIAEVYVGRASVSNPVEAERFVNKTISYLQSDDPYLRKALLTGEYLAYGGMKAYGAYGMEELKDGSADNGYSTVGIPSNLFEVDELYDRDWPGHDWPQSEIVARINAGQNFITHLGHSNQSISLKLSILDLSLLTNDKLCFIYNLGCHAGWFDGGDCWAEQITVKMDGGAFAGVMNARYGWVEGTIDIDRADGPSLRLAREFWDAVFSETEGKTRLGEANHDSKEDNLWRIDIGANRWVYYETNLFGDPTVEIKLPRSLRFDYLESLPETCIPGVTTDLVVQITGITEGQLVAGSPALLYQINDDSLESVAMQQTSETSYQGSIPPLDCGDRVQYRFSAEESTFGVYYDVSGTSLHTLVAAESVQVVFEDDFEEDRGWTVGGGLWQRGAPMGQGGERTFPDPVSAFDGESVFGYNLAGDYENNSPGQHLTSPSISCAGYDNVFLEFRRWLGVEQPPLDRAAISVSNDGDNWTTVWQNEGSMADTQWVPVRLDISAIADRQQNVYLRWTMGPTDDSLTYCGWNIDNVRLVSYACQFWTCGDADGNDIVNIADGVYLISYIFGGGPAPDPIVAGDADCNEIVNISDAVYLIAYIFGGGPEPCAWCK
jgi:hypothetical protein